MAKKKIEKKETTTPYIVSCKIMGKSYHAEGETVMEAIGNLQVGREKGRAILAVKHAGTVKERVLMPVQVSKLFQTAGMTREINLKNVSLLFS